MTILNTFDKSRNLSISFKLNSYFIDLTVIISLNFLCKACYVFMLNLQ